MDTGKFINNYQYYDDSYFVDAEVVLALKESPKFNIHIEGGYFDDIFGDPPLNGLGWKGFTRDYCELKGAFSVENIYGIEMSNPQEYLEDMMQYANKEFKFEETQGAFNLIADFLRFAIVEGKNVIVEET